MLSLLKFSPCDRASVEEPRDLVQVDFASQKLRGSKNSLRLFPYLKSVDFSTPKVVVANFIKSAPLPVKKLTLCYKK